MACRELLENSFPYDEPILVRAGGNVTVVKIGEFVEKRLSEIDALDRQYTHLQERVEVLTLDDDLKLTFRRVVGIFRHKSPEKLWKITLQSGREIRTTSSHNVFVLTEDLRVACKETRFLVPGDRVLVPNGSIETSGGVTEIVTPCRARGTHVPRTSTRQSVPSASTPSPIQPAGATRR